LAGVQFLKTCLMARWFVRYAQPASGVLDVSGGAVVPMRTSHRFAL